MGGNVLDEYFLRAMERKRVLPSTTHVSRAIAGKDVHPSFLRYHSLVSQSACYRTFLTSPATAVGVITCVAMYASVCDRRSLCRVRGLPGSRPRDKRSYVPGIR